MPVATQVLAGNKADERLYIPAIKRVRDTLQCRGQLYIGDCKMAAIATRGFVAAGEDYYLCPLPATHIQNTQLDNVLESVWAGEQELTSAYYHYPDGTTKQIAVGYERQATCTTTIDGTVVTWQERQLVVRSLAAAKAGEKSLRTRLSKAQAALTDLSQLRRGKKRLTDLSFWQEAAEAIVRRYRVQGLLQLNYELITQLRLKRRYRDRLVTEVQESSVHLKVTVDEPALDQDIRLLGWRVYVTNQPADQLSLNDAVVA
jgi:transposase